MEFVKGNSKYIIDIEMISETDIDSEQMDREEWLEYAEEHGFDPDDIVDMERYYKIGMCIDDVPVTLKYTFNLHGCWENQNYHYDFDSVWEVEEYFDGSVPEHIEQLVKDEEFQRYICEQCI